MDEVKIRELEEKSTVNLTDLLIVEDNDGTKTTTVSHVVRAVKEGLYFDTVKDMKRANLHEGDVVTTLGFYKVNDGGGAKYKIVYAPTDVEDKMLIHYLDTSDTLRAHLICDDNRVNVLQAGAHGDGKTDDTKIFTSIINSGKEIYLPKTEKGYYVYNITNMFIVEDIDIDFNGNIITGQLHFSSMATKPKIRLRNGIINGISKYALFIYTSHLVEVDNITINNGYVQFMSNWSGTDELKLTNFNINIDDTDISSGTYISGYVKVIMNNINITGYDDHTITNDAISISSYIADHDNIISISNTYINITCNTGINLNMASTEVSIADCKFAKSKTALYMNSGAYMCSVNIDNIRLSGCENMIHSTGMGTKINVGRITIPGHMHNESDVFKYFIKDIDGTICFNSKYTYPNYQKYKTPLFESSGRGCNGSVYDQNDPRLLPTKLNINIKQAKESLLSSYGAIELFGLNNMRLNVTNADNIDKTIISKIYNGTDGQIITLQSDDNITLQKVSSSSNIKLLGGKTSIPLSSETPIVLQYINTTWVQLP